VRDNLQPDGEELLRVVEAVCVKVDQLGLCFILVHNRKRGRAHLSRARFRAHAAHQRGFARAEVAIERDKARHRQRADKPLAEVFRLLFGCADDGFQPSMPLDLT